MKKISLTFLGVLLSITQIGYSQDNVLRCKEEKTSQIPYWVGVTEPTSWTTSHNYYDRATIHTLLSHRQPKMKSPSYRR